MKLPLSQIESVSAYAVYCAVEGLVSGHEKAVEALKALAAHLKVNPRSSCQIYARTAENWV